MRSAAAMASYRSYRDANSKAYMDGIGLKRPGDPMTFRIWHSACRLPVECDQAGSARPLRPAAGDRRRD